MFVFHYFFVLLLQLLQLFFEAFILLGRRIDGQYRHDGKNRRNQARENPFHYHCWSLPTHEPLPTAGAGLPQCCRLNVTPAKAGVQKTA